MKLITEMVEEVQVLSEDSEDGKTKSWYVQGPFLQGGIKNRNNRIYPMGILEPEASRYIKEYVNDNRAMGELGHPQGPIINLDRVSHKIIQLVKEGNDYIGKAKIIAANPMGQIAIGLLSEGVKIGASSRAIGTVKRNNQGINEVQEDFHISTAADLVADPSAPSAFVNGIYEGVEYIYNNGALKEYDAEALKEEADKIFQAKINREARIKALFESFMTKISMAKDIY